MANPKLKIDTPQGSLYTQASKSGKVTAILEWNKGFGAEFTEKFSSAQKFVDSEVLIPACLSVPANSAPSLVRAR